MFTTVKFLVGSLNFGTINYSIYKQSRIMQKLLDKELKNQKKKNNPPKKLAQQIFPAPNQSFDRRLTAINKFYMQHITETMQGEKYSSQLVNLGIEISKVKISKDFSYINVYWISKNKILNEEELQKILTKASGELQREICSLRHIGKLPELRFVKDINLEKQIEVERLLAVIDFGRDYEPSNPSQTFGSDCFSEENGNTSEMRQNILGLDHAKITARILVNIGKFKTIELPEKDFELKEVDSMNLIPFDKKTFEKFFRRRQILKRKMQKNMIRYIHEDYDVNERENKFLNEYWSNEEFEKIEELEDEEEEEDFHRYREKDFD